MTDLFLSVLGTSASVSVLIVLLLLVEEIKKAKAA